MFSRSVCRAILGLLVIGSISLGLSLNGQQQESGLTQPPKPSPPKSKETASDSGAPFVTGERLSFNVSWANFVTAARLQLEVAEQGAFFEQEGYQLKTRLETIGYVRSLFVELDNQYTSYVDAKTMLPYRLVNLTQQGLKREESTVVLDQQQRIARYDDGKEITLPPSTYDLPSLLYTLRLRELKQGATHKFSALYEKETVEVEAQIKQRERVITQAGTYNAVRVDFSAKSKKRNLSQFRVRAWFSDDAQRLPVLITAQLPFGEVRVELANAMIVSQPKAGIALSPNPVAKSPLIASKDNLPAGAFEAASKSRAPLEYENHLPFAVGERLNYDISWLNLPSIGKVSFEVRQQGYLGTRRVFELVAEAATVGAARAVFDLNDQFICYADVESLMPVKTSLRLREGERTKQAMADFDWHAKVAKLDDGTKVLLQPNTRDLVSLFYALRAADLKIGSSFTYYFLTANHHTRRLLIRVAQQETITGPMGQRETTRLDIFSQQPQQLLAQAWISNDTRRLPIYVAVRLPVGELRAQLTGVTNLK